MGIGAKRYKLFAIAIVLFAVSVRLLGLRKGIWLDEFAAIEIISNKNIIAALKVHDYPPAYFFMLRIWSRVHFSEPFFRLLSVLMGTATVIIVIAWLKSYSVGASLIAGLLVATIPFLIRYSQEIQTYPLLILTTAATFYAAQKIYQGNAKVVWYVMLSIALCISAATHMVGIMVTISVGVYLLPTFLQSHSIRPHVKFIGSVLFPAAVFLFVYYFFAQSKDSNWWIPELSVNRVREVFSVLFGFDMLLSVTHQFKGISDAWIARYELVVFGALLTGAGGLLFGNWRHSWNLLGAALIFWIEIMLVTVLFVPIFLHRTLLPSLIPLIGFVSIQAVSIRIRPIRTITIASICLLSTLSLIGWVSTSAFEPIEPWKPAAQYIQESYQSGDLIVYYPEYIRPITQYHLHNVPIENSMKIDIGTAIEVIDAELEQLLAETTGSQLFLVVRTGDTRVWEDTATYNELLVHLDTLKSSSASPYTLNDKLEVTKYEIDAIRPNLLDLPTE